MAWVVTQFGEPRQRRCNRRDQLTRPQSLGEVRCQHPDKLLLVLGEVPRMPLMAAPLTQTFGRPPRLVRRPTLLGRSQADASKA
jgi:hypothetical protein